MRTTSNFAQNLLSMQSELHRFALKLTADAEDANDLLQETSLKALDNEEKYTPDTNFKGWMYTIMRNIFINNYRKTVRDQTFVDHTENLFHLNLPQDSGFESTEGNPSNRSCTSERIPGTFLYVCIRIQVSRNCRKACFTYRYGQKPDFLYPSAFAERTEGFPLTCPSIFTIYN